MKFVLNRIGCSAIYTTETNTYLADYRYYYLLNNSFNNLDSCYLLFFIGTNIRLEAPLLNLSLRKNFLNSSFFLAFAIGLSINYFTYPVLNFGNTTSRWLKFLKGRLFNFRKCSLDEIYKNNSIFYTNKLNLDIFIGKSFLNRIDSFSLVNSMFYFIWTKFHNLKKFHILNLTMGLLSFSEISLNVNASSIKDFRDLQNNFIHLNGIDLDLINVQNNFIIYQGSIFNNKINNFINLVLPVYLYTEVKSLYLNLEGRVRRTNMITSEFKNLFCNSNIWRSIFLNLKLISNSNFSIYLDFYKILNYFNFLDYSFNLLFNFTSYIFNYLSKTTLNSYFYFTFFLSNLRFKFLNSLFTRSVINYYSSDLITKNSKIMSLAASKINVNSFEFKINVNIDSLIV